MRCMAEPYLCEYTRGRVWNCFTRAFVYSELSEPIGQKARAHSNAIFTGINFYARQLKVHGIDVA